MTPSKPPLHFSHDLRCRFTNYLPSPLRSPAQSSLEPSSQPHQPPLPHLTLTYAQSLDGAISLCPGAPTLLSGPVSKAMTHYLRTRHDAILVGSGTALSDDPTLNSRLEDAYHKEGDGLRDRESAEEDERRGVDVQPRPVVLDARGRWLRKILRDGLECNMLRAFREGKGKAPLIFIGESEIRDLDAVDKSFGVLREGDILTSATPYRRSREVGASAYQACLVTFSDAALIHDFAHVLMVLGRLDLKSVMVEGGAGVFNSIMDRHSDLVGSVIVTVAPVYLGEGSVKINPARVSDDEKVRYWAALDLEDVSWVTVDRDVVLCAKVVRRG